MWSVSSPEESTGAVASAARRELSRPVFRRRESVSSARPPRAAASAAGASDGEATEDEELAESAESDGAAEGDRDRRIDIQERPTKQGRLRGG